MTRQIEDLAKYYAQLYHTPILLFTDSWQVESWDRNGIAIVLPSDADNARTVTKLLPGDLVVVDDLPVARIGACWLVPFPLRFARCAVVGLQARNGAIAGL
jgi:hypothetical protein